MSNRTSYKALADELQDVELTDGDEIHHLIRPSSLLPIITGFDSNHNKSFPPRPAAIGRENSPGLDDLENEDVEQTPMVLAKEVLSPEYLSELEIPEQFVETPISPSIPAFFPLPQRRRQTSDGAKIGRHRHASGSVDHQICYIQQSSKNQFIAPKCRTFSEDVVGLEDKVNVNINYDDDDLLAGYEDSSGISSCATSEHTQLPTHRAMNTFVARHADEISVNTGDPITVFQTREDHWSAGFNMRTGERGLFPSAFAYEMNLDEDFQAACAGAMDLVKGERDTFYLTYLGSVEVAHHKGNDVLVQSINKVLKFYQNKAEQITPKLVLLDINFKGIHVIDKANGPNGRFRCPSYDYFYSLQNISFCGAHPKQLRYFAFITKHPLLPRFASHVFLSESTTQPVVEAIGRAFKKSYDEYMAFAHPTEDIYIE